MESTPLCVLKNEESVCRGEGILSNGEVHWFRIILRGNSDYPMEHGMLPLPCSGEGEFHFSGLSGL